MKLNKEKIKENFGSWWSEIEPISDLLDPIYLELKSLSRRGKKIIPFSEDVMRAFKETEFSNLKCVVIGLSPYHTLDKGKMIADGIALSCSYTNNLQPSLEEWYKALEKEYNKKSNRNPDLSYLARGGVLMLNLGLTCEHLKAASHNDLWKLFIKEFFLQIIAKTGVPIISLGKEAGVVDKYTAPFQWHFNISHPASASYSGEDWDSKGVFKKVENVVENSLGKKLNWYYDNTTI